MAAYSIEMLYNNNKGDLDIWPLSQCSTVLLYQLYFFDTRQHKLPHIHVRYQEHEAVFSIPDGMLIDGEIPQNKIRLVQAWIEIHKEDLMADWELASSGHEIFKIEPLR